MGMRFTLLLLSQAVFGFSLPQKQVENGLIRPRREDPFLSAADESAAGAESSEVPVDEIPTVKPTEDVLPSSATSSTSTTTTTKATTSTTTTTITESTTTSTTST